MYGISDNLTFLSSADIAKLFFAIVIIPAWIAIVELYAVFITLKVIWLLVGPILECDVHLIAPLKHSLIRQVIKTNPEMFSCVLPCLSCYKGLL